VWSLQSWRATPIEFEDWSIAIAENGGGPGVRLRKGRG
jgi:hypothetical protein